MLYKQVQFRGQDDSGNVFCQPLLNRGLEKTAAVKNAEKLHPAIKDFVDKVQTTPKGIYVLVSALGAGEYWGSNVNGDLFPEAALIHSPPDWANKPVEDKTRIGKKWNYGFPTFMGAHPFKHHVNKDPSRAFGKVVMAEWNPKMKRVELVVFLDRDKAAKHGGLDVIERIENGEFPDVSMGCKVPYDVCTICGHKSKTTADYCDHARHMMNKIMPDGRKVAVRNDYPRFFDISFVFIGADKSAKVLAKLAHVDGQVCMGDYCRAPRLSADVGSVFSVPDEEDQIAEMFGVEKTADMFVGPREDEPTLSDEARRESSEKLLNWAKEPGPIGDADERYVWNEDERMWFDRENRTFEPFLGKQKTAKAKRQTTFDGLTLKIEYDPGDVRKGKSWSTVMKAGYGYIPKTKGNDGEAVDFYLAPKPKSGASVYVVRQIDPETKKLDEDKVMLGFSSESSAKNAYLAHIPKERFGSIHVMSKKVFDSYLNEKSKTACGASCSCDPCSKTASSRIVSGLEEKSASHAKFSELIKNVPAGPFRKATLPEIESNEPSIPKDVLNHLAHSGLGSALASPASLGIVLKPQEFQRIILVRIGEKPLADELDEKGKVFSEGDNIEPCPVPLESPVEELVSVLRSLFDSRSCASPVLQRRSQESATKKPSQEKDEGTKIKGDGFFDKVAAMYNGYRRNLVKKANFIRYWLDSDSQLVPSIAGSSMVEAFAGGIEKTASVSVLGPESLAYLVGAHYENRDLHVEVLENSGVLAPA